MRDEFLLSLERSIYLKLKFTAEKSIWEFLMTTFKLKENHGKEKITIEIDNDSVTIQTESSKYKTGERL